MVNPQSTKARKKETNINKECRNNKKKETHQEKKINAETRERKCNERAIAAEEALKEMMIERDEAKKEAQQYADEIKETEIKVTKMQKSLEAAEKSSQEAIRSAQKCEDEKKVMNDEATKTETKMQLAIKIAQAQKEEADKIAKEIAEKAINAAEAIEKVNAMTTIGTPISLEITSVIQEATKAAVILKTAATKASETIVQQEQQVAPGSEFVEYDTSQAFRRRRTRVPTLPQGGGTKMMNKLEFDNLILMIKKSLSMINTMTQHVMEMKTANKQNVDKSTIDATINNIINFNYICVDKTGNDKCGIQNSFYYDNKLLGFDYDLDLYKKIIDQINHNQKYFKKERKYVARKKLAMLLLEIILQMNEKNNFPLNFNSAETNFLNVLTLFCNDTFAAFDEFKQFLTNYQNKYLT